MTNNLELLQELRKTYRASPLLYHATRYWKNYEDKIEAEVTNLEFGEIDSGKYPYLSTFGFGGAPYPHPPGGPSKRPAKFFRHLVHRAAAAQIAAGQDWFLPHRLRIEDIYRLAFDRCCLIAHKTGAKPLTDLEASRFGNPQDLFSVDGRAYTIRFLDYYCRYCFASSVIPFRGDELIVEIGSGSGKQIEVLKKVFPKATFLCFDLPLQLYLCHGYLSGVFGPDVMPLAETSKWNDLQDLASGKIHLFGNWQVELLRGTQMDVFWNAASFGEMEPDVVQNYLQFVRGKADWVYLMQARRGKEAGLAKGGVVTPQNFNAFCSYLPEYTLRKEQDNQAALFMFRDSGGYFDAVWEKNR